MGRSDINIFEEYLSMLKNVERDTSSAAFLGFRRENDFTLAIKSTKRDFYDLQLNNWNINDDWKLSNSYDLMVCTRCAYFSKNPFQFIEKCKKHLNPGGKALIDWGLGDHWRFEDYKVGWLRNGKQEFSYQNDNFLHSCLWRKEFENDSEVVKFSESVRGRFGYDKNEELDAIVRKEIPQIVDYKCDNIKFKFLWPEKPQLYIITLTSNENL
jgi:SAM-dependent methyltransferase